jgi:hypothetical protein
MVHQGGFAGREMHSKVGTNWTYFGHVFRSAIVFIPFVMVWNKVFQGNIWGIPNPEGIVPMQQFLTKPYEKHVDTYFKNYLDTRGFVGDERRR